jgi:transcription elongation factor GreB
MARALLKKEVDDEVVVETPAAKAIWYINSISYKPK